MKASEAIEQLTDLVAQHGDLDCNAYDDGDLRDIPWIEYDDEIKGFNF